MHKTFDLNILPLVAAIKAFDGLTVIGGCAGHPDPRLDQWPKDTLCAECYVAPQDSLATRETPADWFGGIPQGG